MGVGWTSNSGASNNTHRHNQTLEEFQGKGEFSRCTCCAEQMWIANPIYVSNKFEALQSDDEESSETEPQQTGVDNHVHTE